MAATVTSVLAILAAVPSLAFGAPQPGPRERTARERTARERTARERTARERTAPEDPHLSRHFTIPESMKLQRIERAWRRDQRAHGLGMAIAGGIFAAGGLGLWVLVLTEQIVLWTQGTHYIEDRRFDGGGLFMGIFGPPTAVSLLLGTPLMTAGLVRLYLIGHPGRTAPLATAGAGMAWSGLVATIAGVVTSAVVHDMKNRGYLRPQTIVGTNLSLVGALVGLTGLALWAEARRGVRIQRDHERCALAARKITFAQQSWQREDAARATGLPRARIWSYGFEF